MIKVLEASVKVLEVFYLSLKPLPYMFIKTARRYRMHAAEPPCIMVKEMEEIREHIFILFYV